MKVTPTIAWVLGDPARIGPEIVAKSLATREITGVCRPIAPAIAIARDSGIRVEGPIPADTVFVRARRGDFQWVVTMYHDQGQIATKLLGFDQGVTVSGGLSITVMTPAHGTAFDIAGKGVANPGPFQTALRLAARMAGEVGQ